MKSKQLLPVIALIIATAFGCEGQKQEDVELLTPEEAKIAMVEENNMILIDVRTPEEFKEGHIEGAVNIDYNAEDFKQKIGELDTETPVYLYCRSGGRSAKAGEILTEMGFEEIYDIEGGYKNWIE